MRITDSRINFFRGDDDAIMVALKDGAAFEAGDSVFFSLKNDDNDDADILQLESTTFIEYETVANAACVITIAHDDTIDFAHGKYYYDILIEWANGDYLTVVPPTRFVLDPGGSHDVV